MILTSPHSLGISKFIISHLGLLYSCQTTAQTPIDACSYYTFWHSFATLFLDVLFLVPRIQYHVFHPSRGCFSCRINISLVFCRNTVVSIVPKHAVLALGTISTLVHPSNPQFASSNFILLHLFFILNSALLYLLDRDPIVYFMNRLSPWELA